MTEENEQPRLLISFPGNEDVPPFEVRQRGTVKHEFCGCGTFVCAVLLALILWRIW